MKWSHFKNPALPCPNFTNYNTPVKTSITINIAHWREQPYKRTLHLQTISFCSWALCFLHNWSSDRWQPYQHLLVIFKTYRGAAEWHKDYTRIIHRLSFTAVQKDAQWNCWWKSNYTRKQKPAVISLCVCVYMSGYKSKSGEISDSTSSN